MRRRVPFLLFIGLWAFAAFAAFSLIRSANDSSLACATGETWLALDYLLDEGHGDVILLWEPELFNGRSLESLGSQPPDSDVQLELRNRRNDVVRSLNIADSAFIIVEFLVDYDPTDAPNLQRKTVAVQPDYRAVTFRNRVLDEPLRIHMIDDDGDYQDIYDGTASIEDVADPIGTAIDLDAICEAQDGLTATSR